MKVCIVGKGSYIGTHIDEWLSARGHDVYQLDVLHSDWESFDFSSFDAVIQVAGIVHQPNCKDEYLYKRVNTDIPIKIAQTFKSQSSGKNAFVFLSTMAVYGISKRLKKNLVTATTPTAPSGLYGMSKKAAEEGLMELQDGRFNVVIVRPPNVYGKGCRGGYIPGFVRIVKKLPVIPDAYSDIKQSMIYIDNLCELIRQLIENNRSGIFMPQDERAVSAVEIVKAISKGLGKKCNTSRLLGLGVRMLSFMPIINKAYGGVEYSKELSEVDGLNYKVVTFEEGMRRTIN